MLENVTFRFENETVVADKAKIVACNAKKPGEV